jgi:hypothetical protein
MVPAVEKADYEAVRPIALGSDVIQAEIIRQLETADLVLCDISTLNPNVFFELGIRTAVDKPVCLVKDKLTDRIPFDTSIVNVHTYDPSLAPWTLKEEIEALSRHLLASAERSADRNTLWKYFGLTTRGAFREDESTVEEKVDLLLLQFEGLQMQTRSRGTIEPDRELTVENEDEFMYDLQQILNTDGAQLVLFNARPGNVTIGSDRDLSHRGRTELMELGRRWGQQLHLYIASEEP